EDLVHDAAVGMLDDLAVQFHLDLARGDDGAGNRRHHPPADQPAHQRRRRQQAEREGLAHRPAVGSGTHVTPPGPALLMISVWFLTISRSTTSRGPKAVRTPFSSTSSVSHSWIAAGRWAMIITACPASFIARIAM